jgi:parallel beta-helix repeat protein
MRGNLMRFTNQISIFVRLIFFLVGFILFYDELWMFGIPLGRILPDLSDFHIDGVHHWMFGLFLMLVVVMHFIYSSLIQMIEQKQNYKVKDRHNRFIFTGLVFIVFFIFLLSFSNSALITDKKVHSGLLIIGNSDFRTQATTENWPGDGSQSNPYLIENLQINGSGDIYSDTGETLIDIRNTDVHFRLQNLQLSHSRYGIRLTYVVNGQIVNNTISDCYSGIILRNSEKIVLSDNFLHNNGRKKFLHPQVTNNAISGKHILYWQNINRRTALISTDQFSLIYKTSLEVTSQEISDQPAGLVVLFGSELLIHENIFSNNSREGLHLSSVERSIITNNTINNNSAGIILSSSNYNTLSHNIVTNNPINGIDIFNSFGSILTSNLLNSNGGYYSGAISLSNSHNSTLSYNDVNNTQLGTGIFLWESKNTSISNNSFSHSSSYGLYFGVETSNNIVKWNQFIQNNLGETSQAFDEGMNNTCLYNFWDDWTNPDVDNDSFVDQPYSIDGSANNFDPYPLCEISF